MSIRQQARDAAMAGRPRHWTDTKAGADAAGDVWEQYLQAALEHSECRCLQCGAMLAECHGADG